MMHCVDDAAASMVATSLFPWLGAKACQLLLKEVGWLLVALVFFEEVAQRFMVFWKQRCLSLKVPLPKAVVAARALCIVRLVTSCASPARSLGWLQFFVRLRLRLFFFPSCFTCSPPAASSFFLCVLQQLPRGHLSTPTFGNGPPYSGIVGHGE